MKAQLMVDAEALSKRIREEAALTAKLEIEKAKNHLRDQIIKESFAVAQAQLSSLVSKEDHARLQGEFLHNIQVVQR